MPSSLKCKIKKLMHDGKISEMECHDLLIKLAGHDKQVKSYTIDECIKEVHKYFCSVIDEGDIFSKESNDILTHNKYICESMEGLK